jgi:hypothetical protein
MHFSHAHLFNGLWICVVVAQSCLWALLIARKVYREYPAFFTFISFCVARSFCLLYISHTRLELYQPVKWILYVPQLAILIALVLEVFYVLFHPLESFPSHTIRHFVHSAGAVLFVAVVFALFHPGAQPTAWMTFARAVDQVVSWFLCAFFVLLALFSKYFGIPWRHRVYGIGLGFVIYLCADVAVTTVIAQMRLPPYSPIWLLDMFAFLVACLTWMYYFRSPEAPGSVPSCEQIAEIRAVLGVFATFVEGTSANRSRGQGPRHGNES